MTPRLWEAVVESGDYIGLMNDFNTIAAGHYGEPTILLWPKDHFENLTKAIIKYFGPLKDDPKGKKYYNSDRRLQAFTYREGNMLFGYLVVVSASTGFPVLVTPLKD